MHDNTSLRTFGRYDLVSFHVADAGLAAQKTGYRDSITGDRMELAFVGSTAAFGTLRSAPNCDESHRPRRSTQDPIQIDVE